MELGLKIKWRAKVNSNGQMGDSTKDSIRMTRSMALESSADLTEGDTRGSGVTASNTARAATGITMES